MCRLPGSGFTETPAAVFNWAADAAALARRSLPGGPLRAHLWSFRHDSRDVLVLGLIDGLEISRHCVHFTTGFPHNFDLREPYVPDLAEAIHMAGIVLEALEARVEWVGMRGNEVNPEVLARPLGALETNGPMKVARARLGGGAGHGALGGNAASRGN